MNGFTIYREYYDLITLLSEKEQQEILLAITKYMFEDIEPTLNDKQAKIFNNLKRPLIKSKEQSKRKTKLNPNENQIKTELKPNGQPNENTSNDVNVIVNDNVNVNNIKLSLEENKESNEESERKDISSKQKYGEYKHVLLTKEELQSLASAYGDNNCLILIKYLDEYIEMKGYKAKSHYLCIKKWVVNACKEKKLLNNPTWLNKNVESKPATTAEKKEIDDLLSQF